MVVRAFWTVVGGIMQGVSGPKAPPRPRGPGVPAQGVRMVRDPVCGTFLPPGNALVLTASDGAVRYFCSETCRDRFKAGRTSSTS